MSTAQQHYEHRFKNEYFTIAGHEKAFCKVGYLPDAIYCDVFIPKKGTELHTFQGRWEDLAQICQVRSSVDDRKWIVTLRMSYVAVVPPTIWEWCMTSVYSELDKYLNLLIKY